MLLRIVIVTLSPRSEQIVRVATSFLGEEDLRQLVHTEHVINFKA